ncbi:MAG: DNA repair protein RecO [Candidatus Marinimicrobia bacterium]|nr:DNA repair protein RecO [Candidatus Neomarinimicrobiota bacterium]
MLQNTHAFVLKINPSGESSANVHCFSRDYGKMILIAKGVRSAKSPFKGLIEPFSLLNVHFNEKKDRPYQFLANAEYLCPYTRLKQNPEAILYGSVILEILYKELEEQQNIPLFNLIHEVLNAIESGVPPKMAHWHFLLRFMEIEGQAFDTGVCHQCGAPLTGGSFLPRSGRLHCGDCRSETSAPWELEAPLVSLLQVLSAGIPEQLPDLAAAPETGTLINRILWNALAARFDSCRTLRSVDILRKVL